MDEMQVHCRVIPSIKFSATHLYNWVEQSITRVLVTHLAQEHNVMTLQRLKTGKQFGVQYVNQ